MNINFRWKIRTAVPLGRQTVSFWQQQNKLEEAGADSWPSWSPDILGHVMPEELEDMQLKGMYTKGESSKPGIRQRYCINLTFLRSRWWRLLLKKILGGSLPPVWIWRGRAPQAAWQVSRANTKYSTREWRATYTRNVGEGGFLTIGIVSWAFGCFASPADFCGNNNGSGGRGRTVIASWLHGDGFLTKLSLIGMRRWESRSRLLINRGRSGMIDALNRSRILSRRQRSVIPCRWSRFVDPVRWGPNSLGPARFWLDAVEGQMESRGEVGRVLVCYVGW